MNLEIASSLLSQIEQSQLTILKEEFFKSAVRYAELRAKWYLTNREGRIEMDAERTAAHNVFIDACNILSRNMIKNGEHAEWRKRLGDNRQAIGDFASFIFLIFCLRAR